MHRINKYYAFELCSRLIVAFKLDVRNIVLCYSDI